MSSYAASTTSSTSLVAHPSTRDYSTAFGSLASSYGASGSAPCRASSKTASHLDTSSSSSSEVKPKRSLFSRLSTSSSPSSRSEKYVVPKSQDFGALMDKYGASGSFSPSAGVL